jgi:methane monooxygenase component A beta chain/propane monooxygenase small subunit
MATAVAAPRDFTYIKPRKRRISEYEAVTCYMQPDPDVFDKGGWPLLTREGRPAWVRESTRLRHPHWFDFRDPAALWQRPYVRMQAEQERAIERSLEDAAKAGSFRDFDRTWVRELLGGHYRVWSYFEYGLFRAFAPAQREALADTIGNALCFESADRVRHAQAIVLYMMDLEANVEGFRDQGSKDRWIGDARYQPARRLVEQLAALEDWAELAVVVNLVVDPILSEVAVSQLVRRPAPLHGDGVTPLLVMTTERDRRRNQAWTEELVRTIIDSTVPAAGANREVMREWLERWTPRVVEAMEALAPMFETLPIKLANFRDVCGEARRRQTELVTSLGLSSGSF